MHATDAMTKLKYYHTSNPQMMNKITQSSPLNAIIDFSLLPGAGADSGASNASREAEKETGIAQSTHPTSSTHSNP